MVALPEYGLKRGQIVTVVEFWGDGNTFEVEFCFCDWRSYSVGGLGLIANYVAMF